VPFFTPPTAAPQPADVPSEAPPDAEPTPFKFFHPPAAVLKKLETQTGKKVDRSIGGALVRGHENPITAALGIAEAPQRGIYAAIEGKDPWHEMQHPEDREKLAKAFRSKIGLEQQEESGALAGGDIWHKLLRFGANTGVDIATDPVSYLPVGKLAELGAKAFPGVAKGVAEFGRGIAESKVGKYFDPEAALSASTDATKATALGAARKAEAATNEFLAKTANPVIKRNVGAITRGDPHSPDIVALFRDPANLPAARKGLRPQEVMEALRGDRAAGARAEYQRTLDAAGLMRDPATLRGLPGPHPFNVQGTKEVRAAQAALKAYGARKDPGKLANILRTLTRLGNKGFLAIPFAHGTNITDLSYMRYGLARTLVGLGRAVQISSGHTSPKVDALLADMEKVGTKGGYGHIFDEFGIGRIAGIPGTEGAAKAANSVLVPLQRASNFAQDKFLNPMEEGLRSSAFEAERAAGKTDVEAGRSLHQAFGSEMPSEATKMAENLGTPFAQFHGQTTLGQGFRTLARNPARVTNIGKADLDFNAQANPGSSPKYRLSVPGANITRAIFDPLYYLQVFGGPIGALAQRYSALTQAQKGHVGAALSILMGHYIPADQVVEVLNEFLTGDKGTAGETPQQQVIPTFVGGYYHRADRRGN
jgi:hypothetical protein